MNDVVREALHDWEAAALRDCLLARWLPTLMSRFRVVTQHVVAQWPDEARQSGLVSVARLILTGPETLREALALDPDLGRWVAGMEHWLASGTDLTRVQGLLAIVPRFALAAALFQGTDVVLNVMLGTGGRARIPIDGRLLQGPPARRIRVVVEGGELKTHTKACRGAGPFQLVDGDASGGRLPHVTPLSGGALFEVERTLAQVVEIFAELAPGRLEEIALLAPVLVPIKSDPAVSHSSALAMARGCIWLSVPANPMVVAETLIHESSHLILHLVEDRTPLVTPGDTSELTVPWRADLRPLHSVLLGYHAWVRIVRWLDRLRETPYGQWADERRPIILAALGQARILFQQKRALTDEGKQLVAALDMWLEQAH